MIAAPMELGTQLERDITAELAGGADPTDAQFRLLVESVSDYAIYLLDTAGRVVSWNTGAERIKGYAAAGILGRHFSIFYLPEDRAAGRPDQMLAQAAREGRMSAQGWRLRQDGSRFWADGVITALRSRSGELTGYAKVTRDLTSWRQAHERIRESEERLQAFTDHSPAIMFLKDPDGRYRFVNRQLLARFGLRREQILGRRDQEVFPGPQAALFAASDGEVLSQKSTIELEQALATREGERIHMVVKFPVFDAAGGVAGIGGTATDITERKRSEQALLEQRTLLAEAQKVAGLGSWEWEPGNGRMSWSEELYRIYGVDAMAVQPSFEAFLERVHPADRVLTATVVARALAEGRGFTHEDRVRRPDGAERIVRTQGEIVRDDKGRVVKLVGACLDVTESRNAEIAQRAAAASLQSLTRRLVQVEEAERRRIAGELHDRVGQNLSALNINLDIVLGALGAAAPQDLRLRLRDSLGLVDGTLQTIEDVMADLRPPLLEEYGLGAALGWYGEEFAKRTNIAVEFEDLARERNRRLRREAAVALFRIAQEALTNVARHANAKRVWLRLEADAGEMLLTIRDEGSGFDPAAAQARASRLGMTTMQERVVAAGGSLELESAQGKGTTLRARVPF
ncbi:MAG: PAS domain S-box protein [Betaproteobacteria bacterium]|nr:MAG: PAS domain S-box protein [Betaproteobacteria bacterium]